MLSLPAPPLTVEESKEAVAVITSLSALPLTNELAVNEGRNAVNTVGGAISKRAGGVATIIVAPLVVATEMVSLPASPER